MYTCTFIHEDHAFFYELTRFSNSHREKPSIQYWVFTPLFMHGGKVNRSSSSSFFPSLKLRIPSAQRSLELSGIK